MRVTVGSHVGTATGGGLIVLAVRDDGRPVSAEELGRLQDIPHGFLQAILADLRRAGIGAGTVRLSIGLEDAQDLIDDLERALGAASR